MATDTYSRTNIPRNLEEFRKIAQEPDGIETLYALFSQLIDHHKHAISEHNDLMHKYTKLKICLGRISDSLGGFSNKATEMKQQIHSALN